MYKLLLISGTSRPENYSIKIAGLVKDFILQKFENTFDIDLVSPADFNLPFDGADIKDEKYSNLTANAHGFIIVTPEYNRGYPGSLKRLLDSEYNNYIHKPIGLVSLSSGPWGGTRAVQALAPVLREFKMISVMPAVHVPFVENLFKKGSIESFSKQHETLEKMINELLWFINNLTLENK